MITNPRDHHITSIIAKLAVQPTPLVTINVSILEYPLRSPSVNEGEAVLMLRPLDGLYVNALLDHFPEGRKFPQLGHMPNGLTHAIIHLLLRGKAS